MKTLHALYLLAILIGSPIPTVPSAEVSIFTGAPGTPGDVLVFDEAGLTPPSRPPSLQGIELLPIDSTGRFRMQELLATSIRLRSDVPGAGRLELPADQGSLYRYRRHDLDTGMFAYGFFLVGIDGEARNLFELVGTGPVGDQDPIALPVALDELGLTLLLATSLAAGGDLIEIDLLSGSISNRTTTLAPRAWKGLLLLPTWGVAVTDTEVLRFDRLAGAVAALVSFSSPVPVWFAGDVVASQDGLVVATIGGLDEQNEHVWTLRSTGPAERVSVSPGEISGIGALPASASGPHLMLSSDGSVCLWRLEGVSREAHIGSVAQGSVEVTADSRFVDTLDLVGDFLALGTSTALMLVGELAAPGDPTNEELDGGDFYRVELPTAGGFTLSNHSLTSGDAVSPYEAGATLSTEAGIFAVDGPGGLLVHEDLSSGDGRLLRIAADQPGSSLVLADTKELGFVELAGSNLILAVRRSPPLDKNELYRVAADLVTRPTLLAALGSAAEFSRPTVFPDGSLGIVAENAMGELLARIDGSGSVQVLAPFRLFFGPTLSASPSGAIGASVQFGNGTALFGLWCPNGQVIVLPTGGPIPGHFLPGV